MIPAAWLAHYNCLHRIKGDSTPLSIRLLTVTVLVLGTTCADAQQFIDIERVKIRSVPTAQAPPAVGKNTQSTYSTLATVYCLGHPYSAASYYHATKDSSPGSV